MAEPLTVPLLRADGVVRINASGSQQSESQQLSTESPCSDGDARTSAHQNSEVHRGHLPPEIPPVGDGRTHGPTSGNHREQGPAQSTAEYGEGVGGGIADWSADGEQPGRSPYRAHQPDDRCETARSEHQRCDANRSDDQRWNERNNRTSAQQALAIPRNPITQRFRAGGGNRSVG